MNTVSVKRNDNIDALKTICAFLVVCIHIKFPSKVDSLISPLERCAVPIFFMISGYFYCFSWERKKKINQIKKLVNLTIAINIFYKEHPKAEFAVMYDRNILPFLNFDNDSK